MSGLANMLNFNSSKVGLIEVTDSTRQEGGGGGSWVKFLLEMCRLSLRTPTPLVYIDPILVTFGKKGNLVAFCLCIYLIKPFNWVSQN